MSARGRPAAVDKIVGRDFDTLLRAIDAGGSPALKSGQPAGTENHSATASSAVKTSGGMPSRGVASARLGFMATVRPPK